MPFNPTIFEEFPVLRTERLTLRNITVDDAQRIFEMRSNGRMSQWIARDPMTDPQNAKELAERTAQAFEDRQAIGWAGILRNGADIIGTCGFNRIEPENLTAEIGGELSTEYWGKNIALEAVSAIVDFGLHTMGLHSIEAKVMPTNRGAIHLLEHLGFRKEAHFHERIFFKEKLYDMAVYRLLKHGAA